MSTMELTRDTMMARMLASDAGFDGRFICCGRLVRLPRRLVVQFEGIGIVGAADLAIGVGARTNLKFNVWRRPLPSNFDTYYIVNSFRMGVERPFLRQFMAGLSAQYSRSEYGDLLPIEGETEIRKDQRYLLEAYFDWFVHPRVAIRIAGGHQERMSSFDDSDFKASAATVGLRLGWF